MNQLLNSNNINKQVLELLRLLRLQENKTNYEKCAIAIINTTKIIINNLTKQNPRIILTPHLAFKINKSVVEKILSDNEKFKEQQAAHNFKTNGSIGNYKMKRDSLMYNKFGIHENDDRDKFLQNTKSKNSNSVEEKLKQIQEENKLYGINNNVSHVTSHKQIQNTYQNNNHQHNKQFIPSDALVKLQNLSEQPSNIISESEYLNNDKSVNDSLINVINEREQFNNQHYSTNQQNNYKDINNENAKHFNYDENTECEIEFFSSLNKKERLQELAKQEYKIKHLHKMRPTIAKYALQFFTKESLDAIIKDLSEKIINFHNIEIPDNIETNKEITEYLTYKEIIKFTLPFSFKSNSYTLSLPKSIACVKSVQLTNYEFPKIEHNVTQYNNILYLTNSTFELQCGYYTLDNLIRVIKSKKLNDGEKLNINVSNGKISISTIDNSIFRINNSTRSIFGLFGFTKEYYDNESSYTSENSHNLNNTEYPQTIHMYIQNINNNIPLIFNNTNDACNTIIEIPQNKQHLGIFEIKLCYENGNLIQQTDVKYSFVFTISGF